MPMSKSEKAELAARFADHVVEGMDMDTLVTYAINQLSEAFETMDDNALLTEVEEYAPHLIKE